MGEKLEPADEAGIFGRIGWVGSENVLGVGFAVRDVEGGDGGHGGKETDNSFISLIARHGVRRVGGMRFDAQFLIDKALDASLEAVFQTVFTSGDTVINSAASEVLVGKNQGIHLGVDGEIVFHWSLA